MKMLLKDFAGKWVECRKPSAIHICKLSEIAKIFAKKISESW